MSTAERLSGIVCRGTLWRQVSAQPTSAKLMMMKSSSSSSVFAPSSSGKSIATSSTSSSSNTTTCEYCVLTGVKLFCYESVAAYRRADPPMACLVIVGASAWNPPHKRKVVVLSPPETATTTTTTSSMAMAMTSTAVGIRSSSNRSISNNYSSNTSYHNTSSNTSNSNSDMVIVSNADAETTAFRLVTSQGTHVVCQAPTPKCRQVWLATLHAGLAQAMQPPSVAAASAAGCENGGEEEDDDLYAASTLPPMQPPQPQRSSISTWRRSYSRKNAALNLHCHSCGAMPGVGGQSSSSPSNRMSSPISARGSSNSHGSSRTAAAAATILSTHHANLSTAAAATTISHACPLPQYGKEGRVPVCFDCYTAQGLVQHTEFVLHCLAANQQEHVALEQAREMCWNVMWPNNNNNINNNNSDSTTTKTNQQQAQLDTNDIASSHASDLLMPSLQYSSDTEIVPSLEHEAEEGGDNVMAMSPSSTSMTTATTIEESPPLDWQAVEKHDHEMELSDVSLSTPDHSTHNPAPNSAAAASASWIHLPPPAENTKALMNLVLNDPVNFGTWKLVSPWLSDLCSDLESGCIGVPDFLEELDKAVGRSEEAKGMAALKKQAFHFAGDMGTAVKLLAQHALPPRKRTSRNSTAAAAAAAASTSSSSREHNSTKVLVCILDFFLDLCEQGDLSSVAFFWPQFCHIHLRMLPPEDAADVARVELYEDFLLTVAAHYSIHLALELVWSHTADLEDSLASAATAGSAATACSSACRRRRYAVLRFVCELESLLFDFENGWGGGSVSLGKMLQPTGHQVEILKRTMMRIQKFRKKSFSSHRLIRSFRYDTLVTSKFDKPPEQAVQEKLRIAKNADYFSSHLNFTKRICDIAEKLRFLEIEHRHLALHEELNLLNASGAMGGDPLNKVGHDLIRIVRVPPSEGHVFRSKERTPVLLLMEVLNEGAEPEPEPDEEELKHRTLFKSKAADANGPSVPQSEVDQTPESEFAGEDTKDDIERLTPPAFADPAESPLPSQNWQYGDEDIKTKPTMEFGTPVKQHRSPSEELLEDSRAGYKPSPRPAALRRFDGVDEVASLEPPSTPKKDVERLVSSVMHHHLLDIDAIEVPDLKLASAPNRELSVSEKDQVTLAVEAETKTPLGDSPPHQNACERGFMIRETSEQKQVKKKSTLGSLASSPKEIQDAMTNKLAPTGDIRREVLNTIMMRGMQGNTIAANTADSVQRSLKELERQRATALLMTVIDEPDANLVEEGVKMMDYIDLASTTQKLVSLGLSGWGANGMAGEERPPPTEEDEVMESIRLLLIQNRVAQGKLSPADAAKVLQHASLQQTNPGRRQPNANGGYLDPSETPTIDAGDVDPRLVGCGPLPPAVLQAITLWKGEMVSNAELVELVKRDIEFVRHSVLFDAGYVEKLIENSAFWGRFAFGERWAEKKARIAASSPQGTAPGWDLVGVIVKSNDDLRQESFVMQLIELCQEAFELAGLELWINPYRVLATGRTTGVVEMVRNAMSFDALKKRPGYGKGGLREHLQRMTEFTADPGESFKTAQRNFVRSLAAYSLLSHFFLFKDRHNGNLLLDTAGHVIHIDFGFVFGVAPGGSFSLEMSTPFKLTEEMLDVMGGLKSPLFSEFVTLFCCGFLALQSYSGTFLTIVEIMCKDSTFKCFDGRDTDEIVAKLRDRFCPDASKEETISYALDLIKQATTSYGTRQYDLFQYLSQGIAA